MTRSATTERDIVTIASFPKSGVTFLSSLFYYSLFAGDAEDRYREVERESVVDIHVYPQAEPRKIHGIGFIKSHSPFDPTDKWSARTLKVICLTRHPIDVANSSYDFFHLIDGGFATPKADFIDAWIRTGGAGYESSGTWKEHLMSWQRQKDIPMITVQYQDLVAHTKSELERIFKFLKMDVAEECLDLAIKNSSMKSMRNKEEEEFNTKSEGVFYNKSVEGSMARGARFINKGYAGTIKELSPRQIKAANTQFGSLIHRYQRSEYATPKLSRLWKLLVKNVA